MKKKLLFIIYTHSLGGGAERILTNVVNGLNPDKYDIDILEYAQYGIKEEPIRPHIRRRKPIVSMEKDNKYKRLWRNIQVYSYAGFLRKRKEKYDLEISFNCLIPTFLLSKDVPSIAWFHGDIYSLKRLGYYRMLQRKSLKNVNHIVAISQNTKQSIIDIYPEYSQKIQLIYNGFDVEAIREISNEPCEIEVKQPSIAYVGRLEEGKNPLALLDVLEKLNKNNKKIFLYYIGQGKMDTDILEKVEEYGLKDQVFMLGYQTNPYPIMRQCSAICMMSRAEGFPTVFAEGMALGVPFISTHVGGTDELSNRGKCGRIVNNVDECVEAIENYILNEEKYYHMKQECRKHIRTFDVATQIQKIEKLFDETIFEKSK